MHFISPGTPIDFGPYEDSLGFSFRFQNLIFYTNISEFNFEKIILKLSFIHVPESRRRSSLSAVNETVYTLVRIMYHQEGPTTDSTTVHILNTYIKSRLVAWTNVYLFRRVKLYLSKVLWLSPNPLHYLPFPEFPSLSSAFNIMLAK